MNINRNDYPTYDHEWLASTIENWGGSSPYGGAHVDIHYLVQGLKNWGDFIAPPPPPPG